MATLSATEKKIKSNEQAPVSTPEPSSSLSIPFFATDKVLKWHLTTSSASTNQTFNPSPCHQFEIIIDSGASTSYTNNLSDFVSNVKTLPGIPINGIANQLTATAIGTVNWLVNDDNGLPATIALLAMYVPGLPIRLLSPQHLHQTSPSNSDSFSTRSHTSTLRWHLHTKTIHHNQHNNLPILRAQNHTASIEQQALHCAFTSSNNTLSKAQQQLLNEHYRLCHLPMDIIQRITPTSKHFSAEAKSCDIPLCSSCIFGKQHRTPFLRTKSREITKSHMKPGDLVSVDQFESTLAGRFLPSFTSNLRGPIRYCTLFRDNVSHIMFAHMQTSTNVLQTLDGKQKFERFMRSLGIHVKSYRADNGVFATKDFIQNIKINDQHITFSSTGAHFQNGVAERAIRLVSEWARTALLHAGLQWEKVTPDLWPFAVLYAVDVWNHTPTQTNVCPLSRFS